MADRKKLINELHDMYVGELIPTKIVELHLTNLCNHNCIWCISKDVRNINNVFNFELATKLIKEIYECGGKKIVFSGGGEPLLFNGIDKLVKLSHELGMENVLITNGGNLTEDNIRSVAKYCDLVRISLDAGTYITHTDTHRPINIQQDNLFIIKEKISLLIEEKNRFGGQVIASFVITKENKSDLKEMINLCTEIGLKQMDLKTENSLGLVERKEILETIKTIVEQRNDSDLRITYDSLKERVIEECDKWFTIYMNAVIEADGNMYPCCHTPLNDTWLYGNVIEKGFKEIWYGDRRKEIIESTRNSSIGCKACSSMKTNQTISHAITKLYNS